MIRKAVYNDIENINKLGLLLNNNFVKTYSIKEYIDDDNYVVLVDSDKSINGFLIAYNNIENIELEAIVVDMNSRLRGIASSLMEELIKFSKQNKKSIILEVANNNSSAINLYKKYNFETVNIRKAYYKNNVDAFIMKRVN